MTVYIAAMNLYGARAAPPAGALSLNVTTAQKKDAIERRDFSPMAPRPYKGFACFENYWQAGKVFADVDNERVRAWWLRETKPHRRCPLTKDKRCLHSAIDGVVRDYITSRKEVYVPEYRALILGTEALAKWRTIAAAGRDVVVYDFDGPRAPDGTPICLPVTADLLRTKLDDPAFPFGHGYIVAALLAGVEFGS
jgi:hypothetical protein